MPCCEIALDIKYQKVRYAAYLEPAVSALISREKPSPISLRQQRAQEEYMSLTSGCRFPTREMRYYINIVNIICARNCCC